MNSNTKTISGIIFCILIFAIVVGVCIFENTKQTAGEKEVVAEGTTFGADYTISEISPSILLIRTGRNVRNNFPPIGAHPIFAFQKALAEISSGTTYESKKIKSITSIQAVQKIDIGMGSYTEGLVILFE